jgi:proteasome component ECM29
VRSLAGRLGEEGRSAASAMLKPLIAGVRSEPSTAVRRAYAAAAAALAVRCSSERRRERLVQDALASYGAAQLSLPAWVPGGACGQAVASTAGATPDEAPSADTASRLAGGLLLRELLRESSDAFALHAGVVLPVAFIASLDEEAAVASAWGNVWGQGAASEPAALRLYAPELAGLVAGGLASSSWPRKRAAAKARVVALCVPRMHNSLNVCAPHA